MTAIIRRIPARALTMYRPTGLLEDVERLAGAMWDTWPIAFSKGLIPRVDMYEEKDGLVVKAELPGIEMENIDVSLEDDMLTIKAEKKHEEVAEDTTHYSRERYFGEYSRCLSLPFHTDADKVSATLKNGLLEIRLPKAEEAKGRKIEVKVQ